MNAKGTIYGVAKNSISEAFGEDRWNSFMSKLAEKDNYFSTMIMSVTLVPAEKLFFLFDELCKEFFNNDKMHYELFGRIGAQYALTPEGTYKSYMLSKDIKQFVEFVIPKLWSTYWDGGKTTAKLENNVAHIKITGVAIKDIYFEYFIMGYIKQAFKIFGQKTVVKKIRSISAGDDDIYFQFELKDY